MMSFIIWSFITLSVAWAFLGFLRLSIAIAAEENDVESEGDIESFSNGFIIKYMSLLMGPIGFVTAIILVFMEKNTEKKDLTKR